MKTSPLIVEIVAVVGEVLTSSALRKAALLLLPYAGVLVGLDVAAHYGAMTHALLPQQFFLASDGGFGEWLEYSLTLAVAVMLFVLWRWERASLYLTNAVLFAWLTLDNGFEIHERFGHTFGSVFSGSALPIEPNHIGEVALFAAIGAFWMYGFWLCLRNARIRPAANSLILAACVAAAAFFGVVVDLIVVWGEHTPLRLEIETFIEDCGEFAMLCIAFLATVAMFDRERQRHKSRQTNAVDLTGSGVTT